VNSISFRYRASWQSGSRFNHCCFRPPTLPPIGAGASRPRQSGVSPSRYRFPTHPVRRSKIVTEASELRLREQLPMQEVLLRVHPSNGWRHP
jgi:hypothetical protein